MADAVARAADRLAAIRSLGRTWEDAPYLVGLLLLACERERVTPGSGRPWVDRVASAVGGGDAPIANGDYAGYAQAAMELYRLASPADVSRRAAALSATDGPFDFAVRALRVAPASGPPATPWWLPGGYGTRFWVDDLFTLPPWLAMRGSGLDSLPADPVARDLAYEWIESYLYDHRPETGTGEVSVAVPSQRVRAGPLLWDRALSLFRHDPGAGWESYWGRGNGWAAWGLARSARYLDAPYGGGRYDEVVDRAGIREVLSLLAGALAARRRDDGGWPSDLLHPESCEASETSATGLISYMLAKGVNEGWLDRTTFTPIVLKSFSLLLRRLDEKGDLSGIQPPGTGPDCGVTVSSDPAVDVSYGVGALLLAASEVLKFSDADLASMEEAAAQPVERAAAVRTWVVALPGFCERPTIVLTNRGSTPVNACLDAGNGAAAAPGSTVVPPGGTVVLGVARAAEVPEPLVLTLRADGDLTVQPRGVFAPAAGSDGPAPGFPRPRYWRAGTAVPLWTALADGESTSFLQPRDGVLSIGGHDVSSGSASLRVTVTFPDGAAPASFVLGCSPGASAFGAVFVPGGARVSLTNASDGAALVPLVLAASGF